MEILYLCLLVLPVKSFAWFDVFAFHIDAIVVISRLLVNSSNKLSYIGAGLLFT